MVWFSIFIIFAIIALDSWRRSLERRPTSIKTPIQVQFNAPESVDAIRSWILNVLEVHSASKEIDTTINHLNISITLSHALYTAVSKFEDMTFGEIVVQSAIETVKLDKSLSQYAGIMNKVDILYAWQFAYLLANLPLSENQDLDGRDYASGITTMMVGRLTEGGEYGKHLAITNDISFRSDNFDDIAREVYNNLFSFQKSYSNSLFNIAANSTSELLDKILTLKFRDSPAIFESVIVAEYNNAALFDTKYPINANQLYEARRSEQNELDNISSSAVELERYYAESFLEHANNSNKFRELLNDYIREIDELRLKIKAIGGFWGRTLSSHNIDQLRLEFSDKRSGILRGYLLTGDIENDEQIEKYIKLPDDHFNLLHNKSREWLASTYGYIMNEKIIPFVLVNHHSCLADFSDFPIFSEELEKARRNNLLK